MSSYIIVSTRNGLDFLKFTNPLKAKGYCEKMARCGIEFKMEVF